MNPVRFFTAGLIGLVAWLGLALTACPSTQSAPPAANPSAEALRLNHLGVAYMNQQRFGEALKLFEQAYARDPDFLAARLNQGIALLNLQRYPEAREILLEVTERDPTNVRAWYNLGLLDKTLGQAAAALRAFARAAELDPADADTHYFLGLLYTQLEQYDHAIAAFKRALALNSFQASAEFGLARAFQRKGDSAEARRHLERFQHLTQQKLGSAMSLAYGDQGKYSLAEHTMPVLAEVPAAIEVRFVPVTTEANLRFQHRGGGMAGVPTEPTFLGSGACVLDYDADGQADLFLVNSGPEAVSALYRNTSDGRFAETSRAARLDVHGDGIACSAGDYDNDGWTDLAVGFVGRVALFRNQSNGTFQEVTEKAGIRVDGFPFGITFIDYDHDGDLDLYVVRYLALPGLQPPTPSETRFEFAPPGNVLWRNNGNGTFTDWTAATGVASAPGMVAVGTDFNNDRAVDLVVTGWRRAPVIFSNPREGRFPLVKPWGDSMPAPAAGVVVLDFDKDGWMDLAFTHWGEPGLSLWQNLEGKRFQRVSLPAFGWQRAWGLAVLDYDNDGWLDLAAAGESGESAELRLLRNRGRDGFEDVSAAVGLTAVALANPRAVITADYDGDGDTDLLVTQNGGPAALLRNDGGNQHGWLRVALKGLADNRNAIGTKVEVYAGTLWQRWEVQAASGYLGQSALEVTAGLGRAREAEIVRLLWPTGVLQDEAELAAGTTHSVTEIDRRGSSCPILFAWNGTRYEFITDAIGAGVVGHWVAPGERNVSDPNEDIKVEGTRMQPRAGRLSFRFLEPMEELVYLDQVRLLAVDHPADVAVYPNEYFAGSPPFPEFKVIASRNARPPRGAWDDERRNVLPELRQRDRRYVAGLALLPFKGFAELHGLELDLGDWDPGQPLRLLLHGFIEYFTATSVYAAHQAGIRPIAPYVEALDATGHWIRLVDNLGFPAGLARTMVADLTGRLPPGTRRIRLVTNLQIYWDEIRIDTTAEDIPLRLTEAPLAAATLAFRGYPRPIEGNPPGDLTYIYEEISQTGPYARHAGHYTRYGDVRDLLQEAEDKFVIFGSGEEVALEFDPANLPPLPAGWKRDYFFYANGFEKDMDFYAAHALTVEPLPFHSMGRYPPAPSHPASDAILDYRLTYNTRYVSGREVPRYRFDYGPAGSH